VVYIIFHIPKTAGTTLRTMLYQHYFKTDFITEQSIIYPYYPLYNTIPNSRPFIRSEKSDKAMYFFGHLVYYGMHELIEKPSHYIIFVRNPMVRYLSLYNHIRMEQKLQKLSFEEWFKTYRTHTMVSSLVGREGGTIGQAKKILKYCSFIGSTETFDSDIKQLFSPTTKILRENSSDVKSKEFGIDLIEFPPDSIKEIEHILEPDIELYNYAMQLRENDHNKGFGPIVVKY